MTQPRRRPLQRDDLDIERALKHYLQLAPEIELGWSVLKAEMRDAGWPSRTPEGDRKPSTGNGEQEPSSLDYADPCGDMAMRFDDLSGDLDALQDHWHLLRSSLRAMVAISRRHIPAGSPAVPACSVTQCDSPVEHKVTHGRKVYVDCDMISGHWVTRPGAYPTCSAHRRLRGVA
jgi:hypothetical protein